MDLFKTKEEESCFPTLSWKERLTGFAFCAILGFAIELLSFGAFAGNKNIKNIYFKVF